MADVVVEQWQVDVAEDGLKAFAASYGLDKNEGPDVSEILKFDAIGDNFDETTNEKHEISHEAHASQLETGESLGNVGELLEEEVVELEFEKVKPKLETHSMHCPNCKSEITKVILRRKLYQSVREPVVPVAPQPEPQEDLVGCLSCLSLFTFSENGCFNPFDIFRKRTPTSTDSTSSPPTVKVVVDENESCFSMFWVIGKEKANPKPEDLKQPDTVYENREYQSLDQVEPPKYVTGTSAIATGTVTVGNVKGTNNGLLGAARPSFDLPESSNPGGDDTAITIENEQKPAPVVIARAQPSGRPWLGQDGLLLEILKSIVYGGLMEVIASLSIVASAAASDAATLSIVALALATLIGGVFVIGHN
ncbi:membrane protein of ER body-like protein, partial [Tanacetum coccineum]